MKIVFLGAPGAGKGTQAERLSAAHNIVHISTGDIFRANVAEGTELGLRAKRYMDAGEYVPDEVTNAMVRDRLGHEDALQGFILDGYPRTVDQVGELDSILSDLGGELDAVISLTVDSEELVKRLLKRAESSGRSDDTEEVIRRRQDVYLEQTEPLIALYQARGLLREVDGMGSMDETFERIQSVLAD